MPRHRHLKFKNEYLRGLLSGHKRTTIRREKKFDEGEIVYITDLSGRVYGRAFISRITPKKVGELNDVDAINDGFNSLGELLNALESIYGKLNKDDILYVYHIDILEVYRDVE